MGINTDNILNARNYVFFVEITLNEASELRLQFVAYQIPVSDQIGDLESIITF